MSAFKPTPRPRYRVADANLSCAANATPLAKLGFIPRIPATLKVVSPGSSHTLQWAPWQACEDQPRSQSRAWGPYGMAQRGLGVSSQAAFERAEATLKQASPREDEAITTQLFPLQAQRFGTPAAAQEALSTLATRWKSHHVASSHLTEHQRYAGKGRPPASTPLKASAGQIQAHVRAADAAIEQAKQAQACSILGPTLNASEGSDPEVLAAYKGQAHVEGGFRVLKDPLFFVASLFGKQPNRIEGLLMVMTLALRVYSVAPRRRRAQWAQHHEPVPNPINHPTASPPLRGVFQLLEGMHRVQVTGQGQGHDLMEGLNDVQSKILRLFGHEVCRLYHISTG
jgi:transposase